MAWQLGGYVLGAPEEPYIGLFNVHTMSYVRTDITWFAMYVQHVCVLKRWTRPWNSIAFLEYTSSLGVHFGL